MYKILVVDDDKDMCMLLDRFLTRNGYSVKCLHTGKDALQYLQKNKPDIILCDFRLDDMTGSKLLQKIKEMIPAALVIIITGYSDVKDAVEVMKMGAYDYVTKPLFPDEILLTIKKALSTQGTKEKKEEVKPQIETEEEHIYGNSPEFQNIIKQIGLVAPTNFSVIIYGESGSGKEAIAKMIHEKSERANQPFVAIDCGELFGHEKGAFTGAVSQKVGSLETANAGTVFLDEVANLSYDIQVSLLRVVQERKIRRVGGVKDIGLDVRIIVASNEKLWDAALSGRFREDLYHRFNEFSIEVPPLRNRKDDIMLFAEHFLKRTNAELKKNVRGFSQDVKDIFMEYVWHGNLRELLNVVKRATLLTDGELIEVTALPFEINNYKKLQFDNVKSDLQADSIENLENKYKAVNINAEYEVILEALRRTQFNKTKAAKLLNIDRKTLYNKIKQYKGLE
jgi:two-component system response regulator HydG